MSVAEQNKFFKIKSFDNIIDRKTVKLSPNNGSVFSTTSGIDRIVFNIPVSNNYCLDTRTIYIHFDASLDLGTGATWANNDIYFNNSIESIINQVLIRRSTGGEILEDIRNYNYCESLLMNYVSETHNRTVGRMCMGIGDANFRISLHPQSGASTSSVARGYTIPIRLSGISNVDTYIPLQILDNIVAFQVEIILARPNEAISAYNISAVASVGNTIENATYTLRNVFMSYDIVQMDQLYMDGLNSALLSGQPLEIPYKTWKSSTFNIPSTGTNFSFNLNDSLKSINALFIGFWKTEELKLNMAGKDRLHFPTNLTSWQLQLGNQYVPQQPCSTVNTSQCFTELCKALGELTFNEYSSVFDFNGETYSQAEYGNTFALKSGFTAATPSAVTKNGVSIFAAYPTDGVKMNDGLTQVVKQSTGAALAAGDLVTGGVRYLREACNANPSNFCIGINLKKLLSSHNGEIVGSSLLDGNGIMTLRLEFSANPGDTYNMIVFTQHDAVLEVNANQQIFKSQ
jgi:hypothetical protein